MDFWLLQDLVFADGSVSLFLPWGDGVNPLPQTVADHEAHREAARGRGSSRGATCLICFDAQSPPWWPPLTTLLCDEGSELVEVSLGRLLLPYLNGDPVPGCSVEDRSGSVGRGERQWVVFPQWPDDRSREVDVVVGAWIVHHGQLYASNWCQNWCQRGHEQQRNPRESMDSRGTSWSG